MIRIHVIQHVPFETIGFLENVISTVEGSQISFTKVFNNDQYPSMDAFDTLIIMGGPMNIYEYDKYSWLIKEKEFIKAAISSQKKVMGICLGAQLIADTLGAEVTKNEYKEIGWFPIYRTTEAKDAKLLDQIPDNFMAFHWHGDTFEIPTGSLRFAASGACKNQGFIFQNRVIGMQFHLEITESSIQALLQNCGDELVESKYIQTDKEICAQAKALIAQSNQYLCIIFRNLISN